MDKTIQYLKVEIDSIKKTQTETTLKMKNIENSDANTTKRQIVRDARRLLVIELEETDTLVKENV